MLKTIRVILIFLTMLIGFYYDNDLLILFFACGVVIVGLEGFIYRKRPLFTTIDHLLLLLSYEGFILIILAANFDNKVLEIVSSSLVIFLGTTVFLKTFCIKKKMTK